MPIDSEPKLRPGAWLYLDVMSEGMQVCETREEAEAYVHGGQWCQVVLQIAEVYPAGRERKASPLLAVLAAGMLPELPGPPHHGANFAPVEVKRPYSVGCGGMLPPPPHHMSIDDDGPGLEASLEALGLRKVR